MAKFCSSVVSNEAGEFVDDPDGGLLQGRTTLMCDGDRRFPLAGPNNGFGERGEEMDDLIPFLGSRC